MAQTNSAQQGSQSARSAFHKVEEIPIVGPFARWVVDVVRLPAIHRHLTHHIENTVKELHQVRSQVSELHRTMEERKAKPEVHTNPSDAPIDLPRLMEQARRDPAFLKLQEKFAAAKVQNWLLDEEKYLLFAVGAFYPGEGVIVEIGSFQGGSAAFFGGGIGRRGQGKLYCLDPHLGGPPWLGLAPHQRTLPIFREKLSLCGVAQHVRALLGDSASVASVWPALPIDAVFIDGDHSFRGALRDFECWVTKVRPGGLIIIDDADDAVLPELLDFIELVKTLRSVQHLDTVKGMAVFRRVALDPWETLQELNSVCISRNVPRPWEYSILHDKGLPANYQRSPSWGSDHGLEIAYQLCFLARCGPGLYGFSKASAVNDREILYSLSRDRNDGEVVELNLERDRHKRFRSVVCCPEEAAEYAPLLMPGGVLITREQNSDSITTRTTLLQAGLEGCGYDSQIHWGIWQTSYLAPDAVMEFALQAHE